MDAETRERDGAVGTPGSWRVVVVATDALTDAELLDELRRDLPAERAKVVLVAPAVEESVFHHALGDVDGATREARRRLDRSLAELHRRGISALGEIGDSDPVVAAAEALRQYPADEVLIVAHAADQARWFEEGLFDRAREALYPPVRMIAVRRGPDGTAHVAATERAGAGREAGYSRDPGLSPSPPRLDRGRLAWIGLAVVATVVAAALLRALA